jgi:dynein heavy chain
MKNWKDMRLDKLSPDDIESQFKKMERLSGKLSTKFEGKFPKP